MRIQLIGKPDSQMTGLRRYQDTLYEQLGKQDCSVQKVFSQQPIPRILNDLGQRFGWDLDSFFQSYPLWGRYLGADVYHLANESLATLLLLCDLRPSVVTVHGLLPYLLQKKQGRDLYDSKIHRWFDALSVQGLRRAQRIIAVSHFLKGELVRHTGIPDERIDVIHEAVDHDFFRPQTVPASIRERYGLDKRWRYVLYVGSEQPEKNFLTLVRAFAALRKRRRDVKLLKVGQPEFHSERIAAVMLIQELGINDDVMFLGHIGNDLPLIYSASDLFVFPSRFEGFGFPPLEAMACGIPVICSDAGALPEVVGDAALLVDPADQQALVDAMEKILDDQTIRDKYVSRGVANAKRFQWDVTAQKTIEVYRRVISDG